MSFTVIVQNSGVSGRKKSYKYVQMTVIFVARLFRAFGKCHCFSPRVKKLKRNLALLYFHYYFLCKPEKWSPRSCSHLHNADFSNLALRSHQSGFPGWFQANLDFQLSIFCQHWKHHCKGRGARFTLLRFQSDFSKSLDLFWCLCRSRV